MHIQDNYVKVQRRLDLSVEDMWWNSSN